MYTLQIAAFISFMIGMVTIANLDNTMADMYGWPFIILSFVLTFIVSINRKKFKGEDVGQNFKDNDYLKPGEVELKRMINSDVTTSMIGSFRKAYMQDVAVTNKRVIVFGNTLMKTLNMPTSIFYERADYEEFKSFFNANTLLVQVETRNDKTYLITKPSFFKMTYSFIGVEMAEIINKNFRPQI